MARRLYKTVLLTDAQENILIDLVGDVHKLEASDENGSPPNKA